MPYAPMTLFLKSLGNAIDAMPQKFHGISSVHEIPENTSRTYFYTAVDLNKLKTTTTN